jgi:hypothetical protein
MRFLLSLFIQALGRLFFVGQSEGSKDLEILACDISSGSCIEWLPDPASPGSTEPCSPPWPAVLVPTHPIFRSFMASMSL